MAAGDQLGISVSGLGDINGDGADDFTARAPGVDGVGTDSGASYVIYGRGAASFNPVVGSAGADSLAGTSANDGLSGLSGGDIIAGLGGQDISDGGTGFDYADYRASNTRVFVNLTAGAGLYADAENDTYESIEGAIGSSFNDILTGSHESNHFIGRDRDGGMATAPATASSSRAECFPASRTCWPSPPRLATTW